MTNQDDRDRDQEAFDREIKEARRRHFEKQKAETTTLLQYRPKKRRRPPPPPLEVLPGGGLLYEDVLPVPAHEEPESNVIKYTGYEFDFGDL